MVIQGKALFAYTQTPDDKFGSAYYRLILEVDADTAAKLLEVGLEKKDNDEGLNWFQFKRPAQMKSGRAAPPPKVVDKAKQPFSEEIGNNSVVNVAFNPVSWEWNKKKGVMGYLNAVQVLEFIPWEPGVDEFEALEEHNDIDNPFG